MLPRDFVLKHGRRVLTINIHDFTLKGDWEIIEASLELNNNYWLQLEM